MSDPIVAPKGQTTINTSIPEADTQMEADFDPPEDAFRFAAQKDKYKFNKEDPLGKKFMNIYKLLPEKIDFRDVPKIANSKKLWREQIKNLENCFAQTIGMMEKDFEEKVEKYDKL